jgi:DNA-binding response OmpR family regulator
MRTSGDRLCLTLRNTIRETPLIHIKPSPAAKSSASVADVLLYMPFTYRKLYNRIDRFAVNQEGHVLSQGIFRLNTQQHILTTPNGDQKLTPKLAKLMEVLMKNVNQVVERKELIKQVWETDYMGDTRTLDVHIRWIRQAVEADPNHPQYIKTVRGKGYMLAISD